MDDSDVTRATYNFPGERRWSGSASTSNWSDPGNWSPFGMPSSVDDVILDNSIMSGNYSVDLPGVTSPIEIVSLVISPQSGNTITLNLPNSNSANPGLRVSGVGDALVLNEGGVFRNSSGASSGSGFELSGSGSQIRINSGGHYIHNTTRTHAVAIAAKLSTASGTENGVFEFDVPGTSNYALSLTGRTYGTMVLNSAQSLTYTGSGGSSLSVKGSLIIGNNVTFSPDLAGLIEIENNLIIEEDATFVLSKGTTVSVNGTLTNAAGPSGLVIKSDATGTGSLIHNNIGVQATIERHIPSSTT